MFHVMIYFLQDIHRAGPIKIGYTDGYAVDRMRSLQTGAFVELVLLATCEGTPETERLLHVRFAQHRVRGEWFAPAAELTAFIDGVAFASGAPPDVPATRPAGHVVPTSRRSTKAPTETELRALLTTYGGNVAAVGRELGKERMQVHRWMQRYGIDPAGYRD